MRLYNFVKIHFKVLTVCFNITFLSGCAVFFPAHPNSDDRVGENVQVERMKISTIEINKQLIKNEELKSLLLDKVNTGSDDKETKIKESHELYNRNTVTRTFIECLQNKNEWEWCRTHLGKKEKPLPHLYFTGLEVAAASAVIGLVIDAAAEAIKNEGSKHEANFGKKGIEKNFWVKSADPTLGCIDMYKLEDTKFTKVNNLDNCETSFDFIRITRTTKSRQSDDKPAFELILYFEELNKEFFVYPVRYITRSAKAKVLDPWCNPFSFESTLNGLGCAVGYIPPLIALKFFQDSKNSIQTNVLVSMDGHWRTPDQKGHSDNINSILFTVGDYSIENQVSSDEPEMKIYRDEKNENLLQSPIAWASGIPVSQNEQKFLTSNGTYTLEVKVGEIDQARVEKMTKAFSGLLSNNKEKITSAILKKSSENNSENK